jgi:hypothetical protein
MKRVGYACTLFCLQALQTVTLSCAVFSFFGHQQQEAWHRPLRRTLVLQMPWASASQ